MLLVLSFVTILDIVIAWCLRYKHAGAYDVTKRKCKVLSTICCRTGLHLVHVIFIHFLSSRPDTYFVFHHFHSFDGTFDSLPTSREVVSATRTHILEDDFARINGTNSTGSTTSGKMYHPPSAISSNNCNFATEPSKYIKQKKRSVSLAHNTHVI